MEVKANLNIDAAQRVIVSNARARSPQPETDTTSFRRAEALDQALQATSAVRPEAVARARELVSNVKYPPADTIQSIAALLALKIEGAGAGSSDHQA
ncbi:MAG: hypothetical protein U1F83_01625 [Verrucomicrobiota bacterium]|jgi:hypothetical protein